jgi:hypothetical protein
MTAIANIKVLSVKGDVAVRQGMNEEWQKVVRGDVLKPEDSIRLLKNSTATLLLDNNKTLTIPDHVILDLADLREMSQEELLLKLAMESIRSLPVKKSNDDLEIPTTTTIHGKNVLPETQVETNITDIDKLRLNGVKVLYQNKYYAGCVLRAKEIFRIFPPLAKNLEVRFLVAEALEAMKLNGEALSEYQALLNENLSAKDKTKIEARVEALKMTSKR